MTNPEAAFGVSSQVRIICSLVTYLNLTQTTLIGAHFEIVNGVRELGITGAYAGSGRAAIMETERNPI